MRGPLGIFACFCGNNAGNQQQVTKPLTAPQQSSPLQPCSNSSIRYDLAALSQDVEELAILRILQILGLLRGSWLTRVHEALATIARFLGATDVRIYGAVPDRTAVAPSSFVLLVTSKNDSTGTSSPPAAPTAAQSQQAPPLAATDNSPMPGQEVRPMWGSHPCGATAAVGPDAGEAVAVHAATASFTYAMAAAPGAAAAVAHANSLESLLPSMLGQMLRKQAPVVSPLLTSHGDTTTRTCKKDPAATAAVAAVTAEVAALVPLICANGIVGALWLKRTAAAATAAGLPSSPPTAPAEGPAQAPAAPHAACPFLLSSPRALQQLGLHLSMCLLAGDGVEQLAGLRDAVRSLSAAGTMQALLRGLSDAAARHVRQRFLMEPWVVTAMVPELSSALGLMFSWGADGEAAAVGADAATATAAAAVSSLASRVPSRLILASGSVEARKLSGFLVGSSEGKASPRHALEAVGLQGAATAAGAARPMAGRVAALVGRERTAAATVTGAVRALVTRPLSENTTLSLGGPAAVAGAAATTAAAGSRVVALSRELGSVLDASLHGSEGGGGGATVVGPGGAPCVALHVKPFPLAHTLLGHVVRRAASAAAASGGPGGTHGSKQGPAAAAPPPPRVVACVVDDCLAHMQDPRKPSRDITLLMAFTSGAGRSAGTASAPVDRHHLSSFHSGPSDGDGDGNRGGRRGVRSLIVIALPAGDRRDTLALYVTFPQRAPQRLLRAARSSVLELLEALAPPVRRKLSQEFAPELETLASAAPGSYAVLEPAAPGAAAAAAAAAAAQYDDCLTTAGSAAMLGTATTDLLGSACSKALAARWGSDTRRGRQEAAEADGDLADLRFLLDSRAAFDATPGSAAGGGGGDALDRAVGSALLGMVGVGSTGGGGGGGGVGSGGAGFEVPFSSLLASARHSGVHGSLAGGLEERTTAVIHVDELDPVESTLHAQVPLLVASLQASISSAQVAAVVAAAAAAAASPHGRPRGASRAMAPHGGPAFTPAAPAAPASAAPASPAEAGAAADLSRLELRTQLGQGGCAVVFRGRLGSLECAIKLMEMPEIDEEGVEGGAEQFAAGDVSLDFGLGSDAPRDLLGQSRAATESKATVIQAAAAKVQLAARRALLRNAMEVAALGCLSHPNIMQVYSTFSQVALQRRPGRDGAERFILRPVQGPDTEPDGSPSCVALVCEWCDCGCLASALASRTFPAIIKTPGGRQSGAPDYRVILLTLLDVAMALRYMHAHCLIHRDVKSANVLLKSCSTDPRGFTAKLADFGFVTLLNQPGDECGGSHPFVVSEETCGTVTHMAPEAWTKPCRLDASVDVYSFGILMWEMTSGGVRPYPDVQPRYIGRQVRLGVRPTFPDTVPLQYRQLAQRCWSAEPHSRPSSAELVTALSGMLGG